MNRGEKKKIDGTVGMIVDRLEELPIEIEQARMLSALPTVVLLERELMWLNLLKAGLSAFKEGELQYLELTLEPRLVHS